MASERALKLNFDGYSLGTLKQLGIGQEITQQWGLVIKAYSKPTNDGFAIEVEVVVLLEGLVLAKALGLSNFMVEGDPITVISWVAQKERVSWRLERWQH